MLFLFALYFFSNRMHGHKKMFWKKRWIQRLHYSFCPSEANFQTRCCVSNIRYHSPQMMLIASCFGVRRAQKMYGCIRYLFFSLDLSKVSHYRSIRKCPIRRYILDVLTHTYTGIRTLTGTRVTRATNVGLFLNWVFSPFFINFFRFLIFLWKYRWKLTKWPSFMQF